MSKNIFLTGAFDGELHEGHINLFKQAQLIAPNLMVFVIPDWCIVKNKKRTPMYEQLSRMLNVLVTGYVNSVFAINGTTEKENLEYVLNLNPSIYAFGEDQGVTNRIQWNNDLECELRSRGCEIVRLKRTPEVSTTQLFFSETLSNE